MMMVKTFFLKRDPIAESCINLVNMQIIRTTQRLFIIHSDKRGKSNDKRVCNRISV